jgi:ABC-type amino acid transport substrate-binding protein
MSTPDLTRATWRTSSRSDNNGGQCVEVAGLDAAVAVRDSKDRSGPVLLFTPAGWAAFVGGVRAGRFDS